MESLPGGRQELLDLSIGQEVFYATIYSQCFHILYITEAGGRSKARENIGDFAGFLPDSIQKELFVKNYPPALIILSILLAHLGPSRSGSFGGNNADVRATLSA